MKVLCTTENFSKGLLGVLKAVATRPTLPVLNHVLITTEKGRLKISATDLEMAITTWVGAKVEQEGTAVVPARVLAELAQSIRDETVSLTKKDTSLQITSHHINADIQGLPDSDFPIIPTVKRDQVFMIPTTVLKEAIKQTIFATAFDETRPVLTALALRCFGKEVRVVATDSFRLSEKIILLTKELANPMTLLIPTRAGYELERLIDPTIDQVEIVAAENQVLFRFGSIEIVSRLIDGQYPDYEAIIPKQPKSKAVIAVKQLIDALKTSLIFARESGNQVSLVIESNSLQELIISAKTNQLGANTAKAPMKFSGDPMTISVNAKFLLDVLNVVTTEMVELGFDEPTKPMVIRPEKQAGYVAVIMPLKTG